MAAKASKTSGARTAAAQAGAGLSIVVPLLNEAKSLGKLHERITEVARRLKAKRRLRTEVVYVDDGSTDATQRIAQALPAGALDVQVVALSRNFGKEAALLAGLDHARLGAVMFMDGDGQHPPSLIDKLVGRWLDDGYDVVYTAKAHRVNEPWLRRTGVKWFYSLINWGARQKIPADAGDFRLLSPRAANALRQMPERNRFFKGLSSWIGFRQVRVDYEPAEREHGVTTWNVWSLVGLSVEARPARGFPAIYPASARIGHIVEQRAGGCMDSRMAGRIALVTGGAGGIGGAVVGGAAGDAYGGVLYDVLTQGGVLIGPNGTVFIVNPPTNSNPPQPPSNGPPGGGG